MRFILCLVLLSCGTTEATRRTFPVSVAGIAPKGPTQTGWAVTLTSATASLTSGRFYSGKVLISRWHFDPWSLIVSSAYAHPGHYQQGQALGEITTPIEVDLLVGESTWGTANAVTGECGSMELTYGGLGLQLKGTATKGAETFTFDTGAYLPTAAIEGVKFDHLVDTKPGHVAVTLNLATLLERVDFDHAGTVDASGTLHFTPASEAYNGFARGILDTGTYSVEWKED